MARPPLAEGDGVIETALWLVVKFLTTKPMTMTRPSAMRMPRNGCLLLNMLNLNRGGRGP